MKVDENMIKNLLTFDPAPRRGEEYKSRCFLFYKFDSMLLSLNNKKTLYSKV